MVSTVPSPSTVIEPPSRIIGASNSRIPRWAAIRSGSRASSAWGCQRSPQALKPNLTAATSPAASRTKIGPLSRVQESSIGSSRTSISDGVPPQAWRTSAARPGGQTTRTGSKAATARIMAA